MVDFVVMHCKETEITHDQMDHVGRIRLAKFCESRGESLSWKSEPCEARRSNPSRRHGPQDRGQVLNECGWERAARTRSCNDAKRLMDRDENDW